MANQPFDTTIINPLERPKSSDINAAQSEIHRDLRDYLYRGYTVAQNGASYLGVTQQGFVGDGFAVVPTSPASSNVTITAGLGFAGGLPASNIGAPSIVGLNDLSRYKPMLMSQNKTVAIPAPPGAGLCRRDAIYVKATRQLTDLTASDVYSVASGVFSPVNINKTMTFDLYDQVVQTIPAGSGATWTSGIVYAIGTSVAYSTDDDVLNAIIPSAFSASYIRIAVINVITTDTSYSGYDIADWRRILAFNGVLDITGSATLGGADYNPPTTTIQQLSNVKMRPPMGVRCALSKDLSTSTAQNSYVLSVFSPTVISDITAMFTPQMPLSVYDTGTSTYTTVGYPVVAAIQSRQINQVVDRSMQITLANSSLTSPDQLVAIGQPIHRIFFSVGAVRDMGFGAPYYITDHSNFISGGSPTATVDVSFLVKVAV